MKSEGFKTVKIVLENGDGKQVELTVSEAKELYDQLRAIFGETQSPLVSLRREPYWDPYPWQPVIYGGTIV